MISIILITSNFVDIPYAIRFCFSNQYFFFVMYFLLVNLQAYNVGLVEFVYIYAIIFSCSLCVTSGDVRGETVCFNE